ncbi:uncharacterized protein LOC113151579 [Anabas testudineus]|uniref:uncharacterized protein LOC113151579 n=1 Tax=Anabas testudineus TaxID=64144 RepID=UPI000E45A248|nr:uncharacterized protein LOC113151579 [Anabas testudineus]
MNTSDTGDVKCLVPSVTVESSGINRGPRLLSCFSGLASLISTLLIGLLSGAVGGLLLGAMAVVVLQSLELLDENKLLMEKLENHITVKGRHVESATGHNISHRTCNDRQINFGVSVLAEVFGIVSSTLSLAVGVSTGVSVYSLVIKRYSKAVMGKVVVLAGTVCFMGVTVSGSVLGLTLEYLLSLVFKLDFLTWIHASMYFIALSFVNLLLLNLVYNFFQLSKSHLIPFTILILTPGATYTMIFIALFFKTKLILLVALIPTICGLYRLKNTFDIQLTTTPVPLMLIVTEIFNIANLPIVASQSPASTNTISSVHEGIFVGLLTCQLFTVVIGMSLFASWQKGDPDKICAGAAGLGAAVLAAVKVSLPVLGPGPTLGALIGVAGAVGVCLSAAGAATDHYGQEVDHYGLVGRLGVIVGAATGALLSSCSHSGLSGVFMGLCAALVPAGLYVKLLLLFVYRRCTWLNVKLILFLIIFIFLFIWFNFTCTNEPGSFELIPLTMFPFLHWVVLLLHTVSKN